MVWPLRPPENRGLDPVSVSDVCHALMVWTPERRHSALVCRFVRSYLDQTHYPSHRERLASCAVDFAFGFDRKGMIVNQRLHPIRNSQPITGQADHIVPGSFPYFPDTLASWVA